LGQIRYSSYSILASAVHGGEWSASYPGRALALGKEPPVPIGKKAGWAPRAAQDTEVTGKILCLCRGSNPSCPVRSQTLFYCSYYIK
jgi:hypothetical protein